jgi:hypothetical protein
MTPRVRQYFGIREAITMIRRRTRTPLEVLGHNSMPA